MLLLPAWAIISIFWSSDPLGTARYSLQLALTCLGGVAIAALVPPRRFVLLLFGATFLFALVCIASRRTGPAADGMVLVGLTGSKNQLSYVGQMLISTALAVGVDRERHLGWRALTLPALVVGAYLVLVTKSATGVLTAALAAALFIGFVVYRATAPSLRAWLLIATGVAALGLAVAGVFAVGGGGLDSFRRDVLHKDATLTGRTLLWSVASDAIAQRPVLGHGYKAFWTSGDTNAIGLLRSVNVTDARGFGFQDTYREITVDLGVTGLALLALATVPAFLRLLGRELSRPDHVEAFLAVTAVIFVIRSTVDMSVEPMYIYTTLIYALCGYGLKRRDPATAAGRLSVMEPSHAV
ncbi:O-antigen ligase [Caulobacter sp. S45]|uniref:O-antigen ligase family protein n=1 Tax=Caulobacter sp. S45 TaxID=1641861 RepID=UPI001C2D5924|nr:O-antigen ligase family protein [Caulobacter sp. S45]